MHRLHFTGDALTSTNGTSSTGLLRRVVFVVPLHGWHRAQVHRPWRSDHTHHFWTHLRHLLVHVTNWQYQLGHHLLRNTSCFEHRSDSSQQQHQRLRIRSEGGNCHTRNSHWAHCFTCSLCASAIHAVHYICGIELQVLTVVHSATRHTATCLQDREAVPKREDASGRPTPNSEAQLLLRPPLHLIVLLCTTLTSDFKNLSLRTGLLIKSSSHITSERALDYKQLLKLT